MRFLLDLGYLITFTLASPWLLYRRLGAGERIGLAARLGLAAGPGLDRSIWLHGSSVGEIALLKPLIELCQREMPGTPLVISSYSYTGFLSAQRAHPAHRVILFPFDFSFAVRRLLRHFAPRLIVIVESELWPNLLLAARRAQVPVAILNGKMSEKSCRIYSRTWLIPRVLRTVPLIAVQSAEHAERLHRLGVRPGRVRITGNMKYDLARAPQHPGAARELRRLLGYGAGDVIIIGGSLHEREDQVLLDAWSALAGAPARPSLIIVPRYPADAERVAQAVRARGHEAVRKTSIDRGEREAPGPRAVLIVDTVGDLGTLYRVADIAFVGGSLFYRGSNKGGHNLMEPAILGVPVLFGPYNFSFKETVKDLLAAQAGLLVHDRDELTRALQRLVEDEAERRRIGALGREVVLAGQGATRRNYALLASLLDAEDERLPASTFDRTMPRAASDVDSP